MASTINVCRTALLRRTLALSLPARTISQGAFAVSAPVSFFQRSSPFSTSHASRNASPTTPKEAPSQDAAAAATAAAAGAASPDAAADAAPAALSSCPEGTVLVGLNYTKGKTDPVALRDEDYPAWLWNCLDVMKKAATEESADAGDEFCMFFFNADEPTLLHKAS